MEASVLSDQHPSSPAHHPTPTPEVAPEATTDVSPGATSDGAGPRDASAVADTSPRAEQSAPSSTLASAEPRRLSPLGHFRGTIPEPPFDNDGPVIDDSPIVSLGRELADAADLAASPVADERHLPIADYDDGGEPSETSDVVSAEVDAVDVTASQRATEDSSAEAMPESPWSEAPASEAEPGDDIAMARIAALLRSPWVQVTRVEDQSDASAGGDQTAEDRPALVGEVFPAPASPASPASAASGASAVSGASPRGREPRSESQSLAVERASEEQGSAQEGRTEADGIDVDQGGEAREASRDAIAWGYPMSTPELATLPDDEEQAAVREPAPASEPALASALVSGPATETIAEHDRDGSTAVEATGASAVALTTEASPRTSIESEAEQAAGSLPDPAGETAAEVVATPDAPAADPDMDVDADAVVLEVDAHPPHHELGHDGPSDADGPSHEDHEGHEHSEAGEAGEAVVAELEVAPPVFPEPDPQLVPREPRIIAFMNQKGGVGKTTSTVNIGAALARLGMRVLLIDLDPQGHLSLHLGLDPDGLEASVYDLLVDDDVAAADVVHVINEKMQVIPAEVNLAGAESELAPKMVTGSAQRILLSKVNTILRDATTGEQHFDYVLIDCPPSLGLLTINALTLAGEVIVPMQAHFLALQGLSKLLETVSLIRQGFNTKLSVAGMLLCMHEGQTILAQEILADLRGFLESATDQDVPWSNADVFEPPVRRNIKLAECPSFGQTIFEYAPDSNGAHDYRQIARGLAQQVLTRGVS